MKIIVVQHMMRSSAAQDLEALAESASTACGLDADVVICPRVPTIQDGPLIDRPLLDRVGECAEGTVLMVPMRNPDPADDLSVSFTPLGATVQLTGDQAIDPEILGSLYASTPEALIIRPASESPLQAEGYIELAIALSQSVAGLVVVADPIGPVDDPMSFGGTCIAVLGELVAEAESEVDSELLEVNLDVPVVLGVARGAMPELPRILEQRWAHHTGHAQRIDYPAELS